MGPLLVWGVLELLQGVPRGGTRTRRCARPRTKAASMEGAAPLGATACTCTLVAGLAAAAAVAVLSVGKGWSRTLARARALASA